MLWIGSHDFNLRVERLDLADVFRLVFNFLGKCCSLRVVFIGGLGVDGLDGVYVNLGPADRAQGCPAQHLEPVEQEVNAILMELVQLVAT